MRQLLIISLLICSAQLKAALSSPFASSIPELTTPNSHYIDHDEKIIRGMTPKNLQELKDFNVEQVIIFKSQTRKEVDKEIQGLKQLGYNSKQIHHIPFRWKDFESQKLACEQTITALKIIQKQRMQSKGKVFFHCTVGEDRTGYLAGIFRMLDQNYTPEQAFTEEMCENGYGRGNPRKPWKVYGAIRAELTPLFQYMSELILAGEIDLNQLDESVCGKQVQMPTQKLKCQPSSKYKKK